MKFVYLAGGLVKAETMSEVFFTDSTRCVDLIAQDQEGNLGEFLRLTQTS